MEICTVSSRCVAIVLDGNMNFDHRSAERLVRRLLEHRKLVWKAMYIDVFTYDDRTLLLARPEEITKVYIAPYALPWLADYFTE